MKSFRVPDLAEGLQEVELLEWHVAAGDEVRAGQPMLTVETDKAVVEMTVPWSGRIVRTVGEPGERMPVGAVLVEFEGADDEVRADAGTVVGELPEVPVPAPTAKPAGSVRVSPAVRARARALGIDLARVRPTGPGGAISTADLERTAQHGGAAAEYEALRGVRLSMARNMARARAEVAHATISDEADVHAWTAQDVTVRLIRAVASACRAEPALNAWFDGRALARCVHEKLDLGLAMQTKDGLFVPVLRDAAALTPQDLRSSIEAMRARVEDRSVRPEELRGATFTLSNFGVYAGRQAALVVMPPQVAILGTGRIAPRPVVVDERVVAHRTLPLSLSFDHRCVTGSEATGFLAAAIDDLQRPD